MSGAMMSNASIISLMRPLIQVLDGTEWWEKRYEVAWYVNRCEIAGFCDTDDMRRLCAKRYMAGKRKVTPPGTERRKRAERERRKILSSVPQDLMDAISDAVTSEAARQFAGGNDKALNAVVGIVLRRHKADPAAVRKLIVSRLRGAGAVTERDRGNEKHRQL